MDYTDEQVRQLMDVIDSNEPGYLGEKETRVLAQGILGSGKVSWIQSDVEQDVPSADRLLHGIQVLAEQMEIEGSVTDEQGQIHNDWGLLNTAIRVRAAIADYEAVVSGAVKTENAERAGEEFGDAQREAGATELETGFAAGAHAQQRYADSADPVNVNRVFHGFMSGYLRGA